MWSGRNKLSKQIANRSCAKAAPYTKNTQSGNGRGKKEAFLPLAIRNHNEPFATQANLAPCGKKICAVINLLSKRNPSPSMQSLVRFPFSLHNQIPVVRAQTARCHFSICIRFINNRMEMGKIYPDRRGDVTILFFCIPFPFHLQLAKQRARRHQNRSGTIVHFICFQFRFILCLLAFFPVKSFVLLRLSAVAASS